MKTETGEKAKRNARLVQILTLFVFGTLLVTAVFTVVRIILAPSGRPSDPVPTGEYIHIKSDYVLILGQCILGMAVMLIPGILQKRFRIVLPHYMHVLFVLFLYAAIYLGEARNFYYTIPHWDTFLHTISSAMFGAFGFSLISLLNDIKKVRMHLSALFVAMFAFCFAVSLGVVWEIYEYSADALLGLNMQKHTSMEGIPYAGNAALADTMKDMITDAVGALAMSVIGYLSMRKHPGWLENFKLIEKQPADGADTAKAEEKETAYKV